MATITTIKGTKRWHWRRIAYSILAGLFALMSLFIGAILAPTPWQPLDPAMPWLTKWHTAGGAMENALLVGVLLLATLWRPQKKAGLMQLLFWETLISAPIIALLRIFYLGFDLSSWLFYALMAVLFVLSPVRGQLFSLKGEGAASKPLLVLTIAAGLLLVPDLFRNAQWQITGFGGDHALRYLWLEMIFGIMTLVGGGFLTAIKRPGWQVLGILLGISYLYLGIVAISIPDEIGSWGTVGGILSILGGVAYLALTLWEMRRSAPANTKEIR
jgi:hypothetical protein